MKFFVILNHTLTDRQISEAKKLGAVEIVLPPDDIKKFWANVEPSGDLPMVEIAKVTDWLSLGQKGDYVLVQGDFGATYYIVSWCKAQGMLPVYSTTRRVYESATLADGSVEQKHIIKHINFRRYKEAL
jgi:hypothetical protein